MNIIHNYLIPVRIIGEITDNSIPINDELNNKYLLYKCIRDKDFYILKLCGCNRIDIKSNFDKIVVFSLEDYHVEDYFLISKEDLLKNTFVLKSKEKSIKDYYGCYAISEFEKREI